MNTKTLKSFIRLCKKDVLFYHSVPSFKTNYEIAVTVWGDL